MIRPAAACAAALMLMLTSCARDADVDVEALQADIAAGLFPSDPSAVSSVTCPGAAEGDPGDELSCTVLVGSQELPVEVLFERDGTVRVTPGLEVLDGSAAAAQIAERLSADLGVVTDVECVDRFVVLAPGATFVCVATDDKGVTRSLDVSVDSTGQLVVALS